MTWSIGSIGNITQYKIIPTEFDFTLVSFYWLSLPRSIKMIHLVLEASVMSAQVEQRFQTMAAN